MTRASVRSVAFGADGLELALLQHAQQLRLKLERTRVADLVEEDRAAPGELESAARDRHRAGEAHLSRDRTARSRARRRERGAVQRDERLVRRVESCSGRRARRAPCLCRSRRESDTFERVARGLPDELVGLDHPRIAADETLEPVLRAVILDRELVARSRARRSSNTRATTRRRS